MITQCSEGGQVNERYRKGRKALGDDTSSY